MSRTTVQCLLTDDEWAWLASAATDAGLPDRGKAFRCCINCLAQDVRSGEALGASPGDDGGAASATRTFRPLQLAASQGEWLSTQGQLRGYGGGEAFASVVVRACQGLAPEQVFGVVRCKTATASRGAGDVAGIADAGTACAGAQEALAAAGAEAATVASAAAAADGSAPLAERAIASGV
jgi:hypothetical protein